MKTENKQVLAAIKEYQCSGCVLGSNPKCKTECSLGGVGCGLHRPGTFLSGVGEVFLGMPKGFNRLGVQEDLSIIIYEQFTQCEFEFNKWNIPVWKYKSKAGHTFIRGLRPRKNEPFLYIFLEDCLSMIDCLEITEADVNYMD